VSHPSWTEVDQYLANALLPADPTLEEVLGKSEAADIPAIQVSALQGKLLMLLVQVLCARRVLEIGTLAGYSTIWLARGLPEEGKIVTLEADAHHAKIARANIAKAGFGERVDLRLGRALKTLPLLAEEKAGPFDFFFIDADKKHIPEYFDWSLRLSRPGSLIVVDNVVRDGQVANMVNREANIEGIRRFLEQAGQDPRVEMTALQIVGIKGHDGLAIARVKS
jgi:predicted O-methyltransferase YrrM